MVDPTQLRALFDEAASLPPEARGSFLDRACAGDAALRAKLDHLLVAHARSESVFETARGLSPGATPSTSLLPGLGPGTRLGPYVIEEPLGAGGMGEVYRARDTRLGRTVAVKVLPHALSSDATARQRFEREARSVAALSHPHICPLFDVGREGERDYIVMEYLEGETLAARLRRGRLRLREALSVALEIARALAAAHRAGIVHRDLKPGNVMLTDTGVRLLDFGLARQAEGSAGDATTSAPEPLTGTGVILGTLPYMAPEQIEGRPADARTDIFAFGVLLYEMVTGRRAFEGPSQAALVGTILRDEPPPITAVDPKLPPALDRLIRRCIAKDAADRWPTVADALARLEALQDVTSDAYAAPALEGPGRPGPETDDNSDTGTPAQPRLWRRRGVLYVAAASTLLAIVVGAVLISRSGRPDAATGTGSASRVQRALSRLTFEGGGFGTFSPDDRFVVFMSGGDLWVRPTAGGNPVQITHSGSQDILPDWSPDGTSIAFERVGEGLFLVSPLGGNERRVVAFAEASARSTTWVFPMWSPDATQLLYATNPFSSAIRLFLVQPDHPQREVLASFLEGGEWMLPAWHPDGRITIAGRHKTAGAGIYTVSVQDGRWVKTTIPGELLAESHIEQIYVLSWAATGEFLYATCQTNGVQNVWRFRMDADLRITALDRLTAGPGSDWMPKVSRNRKKLLFTLISGNSRLWSFPFRGDSVGPPQPLSEEDGEVNWASLSDDGRRLAYYYQPLNSIARESELRLLTAPFTDPPERIPANRYVRMASAWSHRGDRLALEAAELSSAGIIAAKLLIVREQNGDERVIGRCQHPLPSVPCSMAPVDWTPDDAAVLAISRLGNERTSSLSRWPASAQAPAERPAEIVVSDPQWNISQCDYSPDRRWLAFAYGGEYRHEKGIAVLSATGNRPRSSWRSIAEGFEELGNPRWSHDGKLLYFTSSHETGEFRVWRVGVMPSTGEQVGSPAMVPDPAGTQIVALNRSYYPRIALSADRLIVPMNSQKVAVWMLDNVDR